MTTCLPAAIPHTTPRARVRWRRTCSPGTPPAPAPASSASPCGSSRSRPAASAPNTSPGKLRKRGKNREFPRLFPIFPRLGSAIVRTPPCANLLQVATFGQFAQLVTSLFVGQPVLHKTRTSSAKRAKLGQAVSIGSGQKVRVLSNLAGLLLAWTTTAVVRANHLVLDPLNHGNPYMPSEYARKCARALLIRHSPPTYRQPAGSRPHVHVPPVPVSLAPPGA